MENSHGPVAVLGLGRMGAAFAATLSAAGVEVVGWSRRDTGAGAFPVARTPAEAVHGAAYVLLALYDGPACRAVLDQCREHLGGSLVVTSSTVSPDEAEELDRLVRSAGARSVHAPVLGSVPAVRAGRLTVLAGGDSGDVAEAGRVLGPVSGDVRHVGSVRDAAALKLVANMSLAGALVALGDALRVADGLGLDLGRTLDVLESGPLGDTTHSRRDRLQGAVVRPADFTAGALAKDVRLASAASGTATGVARAVTGRVAPAGTVAADDDVAALCRAVEHVGAEAAR